MKFSFTPAHQAILKSNKESLRVATINTKQKTMFFSIKDSEAISLIGKYLKFYVDKEKNSLAWKVFQKGEIGDLQHVKVVEEYIDQQTQKRKIIRVNVSVPLKSLKYENGKIFKKLPISIYQSKDLLDDKKPYHYVVLK